MDRLEICEGSTVRRYRFNPRLLASNLLKLVKNVIFIVSVIMLVWFAVSWAEVLLKNLNIAEENRVRMSWNAFDVMFDTEK